MIWKKRWWSEGEVPKEAMRDFVNHLAFSYYGEDQDENPEHGLGVRVERGLVHITQWDMTEPPDDEAYKEDWEDNPVLKVSSTLDLEALMDPKAVHRGSYSGDEPAVGMVELMKMSRDEIWQAIQSAAIAHMGYYGGHEEWVSEIGE